MSTTLIKSVQSYTDHGKLQIQLVSQIQNRPVQGAKISISYTGAPGQPLEQLRTNSSGQTETIELAAPRWSTACSHRKNNLIRNIL